MPKTKNKIEDKKEFRPPIVVVLGHVDHGKTSILDYIRKTKVVEKEAGGITQHIGAYQATLPPLQQEAKSSRVNQEIGEGSLEILRSARDNFAPERKITFIDTPGHEAFSAMRSRGARVADLAVLVVAAEEGVKPQTKEAILHIRKARLPMIVVLNKIDKKEAQPEKIKGELAKEEIFVESMGGKVPAIEISAKTGQGINDLLEMILLVAELENIGQMEGGDLSRPAEGVVIESYLDSQRGPAATFLVKKGILKLRDAVSTESACGTIKTMEDFQFKKIQEAEPSTPVLVTGLNQAPGIGEKWEICENLKEAKNKTSQKIAREKERRESVDVLDIPFTQPSSQGGSEKRILNLIIKADVLGSLEAIRESLKIIPQEEVVLRVLKAETSDIRESDIKLAESSKAIIFGFRVKFSPSLSVTAERLEVKTFIFQVIYDLIQAVRQEAVHLLEPEIIRQILGRVKVIAYFKDSGRRQVIGAKVLEGRIERGGLIDVLRKKEKIGSGKLIQLQKNKIDIKEGIKDEEIGILFEGDGKIEIGDSLEIYREERKIREL